MLDLEGTALTREETRLLQHPAVGGVILFSRNFVSHRQIDELCRAIHALRNPHLLIAVDHEGGRVQRFREGFTHLPPAAWYGEHYERQPSQGLRLAELGGWLMAAELRSCGVDFSFAPVLDLGRGISRVIGDRAFHASPDVIAELLPGLRFGHADGTDRRMRKHHAGYIVIVHLAVRLAVE